MKNENKREWKSWGMNASQAVVPKGEEEWWRTEILVKIIAEIFQIKHQKPTDS